MLTKICKCGRVIPITLPRCEKCRAKYQRHYDKYHRKNYDVYHDRRWEKIRKACKARCQGLDLYAYYKHGRIRPGTLAHHIIEVEEDWTLAFHLDNLIWIDDASHSEIHKRYNNERLKTQKELQDMLKKFLTGEV